MHHNNSLYIHTHYIFQTTALLLFLLDFLQTYISQCKRLKIFPLRSNRNTSIILAYNFRKQFYVSLLYTPYKTKIYNFHRLLLWCILCHHNSNCLFCRFNSNIMCHCLDKSKRMITYF